VFPDGSFDGFVQLVQGTNRLRITALGDAAGRATLEREVRYVPPLEPDPAEIEAFRERLRARTAETDLGVRARQGESPEGLGRDLEVEVEEE
jgi:hypothetical protein